jgi:hypothetical protein
VCAVLEKVLFEIIDQLITPLPDFLWNKLVHAHHQDVLILRAIEDDDLAFLRHPLLDAGLILFKRTSLPGFTWNCSLYFIFDALLSRLRGRIGMEFGSN